MASCFVFVGTIVPALRLTPSVDSCVWGLESKVVMGEGGVKMKNFLTEIVKNTEFAESRRAKICG